MSVNIKCTSMEGKVVIMQRVRDAARKKVLFLPHAVKQMSRPERMISAAEVHSAALSGRVIEDYPDDARGHSCLILGAGKGKRPLHIVCSPKTDYLAIVTAYLPNEEEWGDNFATRRSQ